MDLHVMSEEQKAKAREVQDAGELDGIARDLGLELPDGVLEGLSGGAVAVLCRIEA